MFSANSSQVSGDKLFVEDVFSTWLYTGNGSTQTITNGIDLAGKGGLVWLKDRGDGASFNALYDTARGVSNRISSNVTNAQAFVPGVNAFNSNGFGLGSTYNASGNNFVSWTFREAPKFFDVVTYTGDGVSTGRNISHNLGVRPGFIIVKRTDSTSNWAVLARDPNTGFYHGGVTSTPFALNLTNAKTWSGGGSAASATTFNVCHVQLDDTTNLSADFNVNGATYVAYLYAHDATSDGIIQCGSFTTDGSGNATVNLGYEPQWLLLKSSTAAESWQIIDNMRGWSQTAFNPLFPNLSNAETSLSGNFAFPTATGFAFNAKTASTTYVYIAIRRGPMRTPTLGTSVYNAVARTGTGATATVNANMTVDLSITSLKGGYSGLDHVVFDRLRGAGRYSATNTSAAEDTFPSDLLTSFATQNGVILGADADPDFNGKINASGFTYINWYFRRAPGFFDEVCYTGTGVVRTVTHNLGVVPTLTIIKRRNTTADWRVTTDFTGFQYLNDPAAFTPNEEFWGYGTPTSTTIPLGINSSINASGGTYVAYLFASAPGVSKVGSYTGNGSSQTINCAFAAGARFVMIKRTDSTGDWYVWDTARGIVAGNDPYLALNTATAEVTTNDSVDTDSSGFVVNQVAATNVNVNAATYIYLAIA